MPDITVHRHGDRWAVKEPGAESPVKEFPSREAAELAARDLAAGGSVNVVEDDPSGLGGTQHEDTPQSPDTDPDATVEAAERSRSPQSGL
jgi:uncharacterized protein DUF2188